MSFDDLKYILLIFDLIFISFYHDFVIFLGSNVALQEH